MRASLLNFLSSRTSHYTHTRIHDAAAAQSITNQQPARTCTQARTVTNTPAPPPSSQRHRRTRLPSHHDNDDEFCNNMRGGFIGWAHAPCPNAPNARFERAAVGRCVSYAIVVVVVSLRRRSRSRRCRCRCHRGRRRLSTTRLYAYAVLRLVLEGRRHGFCGGSVVRGCSLSRRRGCGEGRRAEWRMWERGGVRMHACVVYVRVMVTVDVNLIASRVSRERDSAHRHNTRARACSAPAYLLLLHARHAFTSRPKFRSRRQRL